MFLSDCPPEMKNLEGLPRWLEVLLASAVLVLASPVMIVVGVAVKLTSKGPVLYRQKRSGAGGRRFVLYKFRSMRTSRETGLRVTARDDGRMTAVGRVLRKLKLDELPELWNVIRGDMALVGPRPEVPDYVDWADPVCRVVMRARPGITDPMTLKLRNEEELLAGVSTDRDSFYRNRLRPFKLRGYRAYLSRRSWISDLIVLGRSVLVVIAPRLAPPPTVREIDSPSRGIGVGSSHRTTRETIFLQYRRPFVIAFQLALAVASNWGAFWLRFDGNVPANELDLFIRMLPWLVTIRLVSLVPFRLYEGLWRYVSVWDLRNIVSAASLGSIAFYALVRGGFGLVNYPRSVFLIDAMLFVFLMSGVRVARVVRDRPTSRKQKRVLIIGAGDAGEMIVREMRTHPELGYRAVGFVDDDPAKAGLRIHGVPVLGARKDLPGLMAHKRPHEVLISIPRADVATVRRMVESLVPFKVPIKTLPNLRDLLDGAVQVNQIRSLSIDDLLPRAPVGLDELPLRRLIEGRRVMVTGAGGSIGSELCRQIAALRPAALILYERYENSLYTIANDLADRGFPTGLSPLLGDVTDRGRLDAVMTEHHPHIVFHAAAHKHVPLMESNGCEAVKNNVFGTRVVVEAAERHGVDRFILISSDKAVNPSSIMGVTKRVAELIVQQFAARRRTTFITVRFGNVLGTSGSVVPRFLEQIQAGGPVTVTHPEVRRYFMLISEAVQLVLHAAALGKTGGLYVLEMGEQMSVLELARNVIRLSGFIPDAEIPITYCGLRPGEKLVEELVGAGERVEPAVVPEILQVCSSNWPESQRLSAELETLQALAMQGDTESVLAQLTRIVPNYRRSTPNDQRDVSPPAIAEPLAGTEARPSVQTLVCPTCEGTALCRSRCRSQRERQQKTITNLRLYECAGCGWRGWLLPPEYREAVAAVIDPETSSLDLGSVDAAMAGVAPGSPFGSF